MLWLLLALQEVEPVPAEAEGHATSFGAPIALRAGWWFLGDFQATLPAGSREFTREAMADVGLDLTLPLDRWFVALSGDYAWSSALTMTSGALRGGYRIPTGCAAGHPLDLSLSAGVMAATLEVEESRFGDFENAVGPVGRAEWGVTPTSSFVASLWGELRAVEFDFEPSTTSGDDAAGGATFAFGLSLALRF